MTQYIGIDLGGTNIRVGAIDENEKIIFSYKELTYEKVETVEDLYKKIKRLIQMVPNYQEAKAIAIGSPGSVDKNTMTIRTTKNLGLLKYYPLVQNLRDEFNKPVYIENDARVAAFAEAAKGAGKGKNIVCYITISTGLGGGVVINNNIYTGANNLGAYFSRMVLDGEKEADFLISGTAITMQAKEEIDENINNTYEVFELAKNGNTKAINIIEQFKKNLTVLLLNISSIINPDIIVLGGGVVESKQYYLEEVIKNFRQKAHPLAKEIPIETAAFDEPGIIGAALLAKNNYEKQ